MTHNIGNKIKSRRKEKGMTLKDVSLRTGLSIGYLSQLERGLTTVAYHTIDKLAGALETDLSYFIHMPESQDKSIIKSFEKKISSIDNDRYMFYLMSDMVGDCSFLPRYVEILPFKDEDEEVQLDSHEGEEFLFVTEGILTLSFEDSKYHLYPGDSAHYLSTIPHKWNNETPHIVKMIAINSPNVFKKDKE